MASCFGRRSALFLGIVLIWISCVNSQFTAGKAVQSPEQFPHHVTVHRFNRSGEFICSASVIHEKWLLTSARCVAGADYLKLDFQQVSLVSHKDSFSITIGNSSVQLYPNEYDDVALVELPTPLQFSKNLKPIPLHKGYKPLERKLGVMVSFARGNSSLSYGMYRILSKEKCKHLLGPYYNKYQQICAETWSANYRIPCRNLEGTALIIDWPQNPLLVGVFSEKLSCNNRRPIIHARISEYVDWITDTIYQNTSTEWPETTTPEWANTTYVPSNTTTGLPTNTTYPTTNTTYPTPTYPTANTTYPTTNSTYPTTNSTYPTTNTTYPTTNTTALPTTTAYPTNTTAYPKPTTTELSSTTAYPTTTTGIHKGPLWNSQPRLLQ